MLTYFSLSLRFGDGSIGRRSLQTSPNTVLEIGVITSSVTSEFLRKRKQALLYGKRGQLEDACRAYEELLFAQCQNVRMVLQNLYTLAMERGDREWARYIVEKHREAVRLYDMGAYAEWAAVLEHAMDTEDSELTLEAMERVFENIDTLNGFTASPLYRHMHFKAVEDSFENLLLCRLKQEFRADPRLDFLRDDPRLEALLT